MSESSEDASPQRGSMTPWGAAVMGLVLLPVLYVGSLGVVVRLHNRGWISDSTAEYFGPVYLPLWYVVESIPGLEPMLFAFVEWCVS
jgi:hypothetical protein